jgi:hypothetical protein
VTDDFVTRLGHALREAADREQRRGSPARVAAAGRGTLSRFEPTAAMVIVAVGAVLVVGAYLLATLRAEPARTPEPRVVARLAPAGALDQVVSAFGSAWLVDTDAHAVLRMDPATRRVTARIPVAGTVGVEAGDNILWVAQNLPNSFRLLRIDPQTNRIVARIRVAKPSGGYVAEGFPVALGDAVWIVGREEAVRVEQATNRATKAITIARSGYTVRTATVFDGDLWALRSDRRVLRFDGRTGARKAMFRVPFGNGIVAFGNAMFLGDDTHAARLDPTTGRVLWRAPIDHVGALAEAGGLVWAEAPGSRGDRVLTLDPRTGRIVSSVHVGEFGVNWMDPVGTEMWMTTAGGHLIILRP